MQFVGAVEFIKTMDYDRQQEEEQKLDIYNVTTTSDLCKNDEVGCRGQFSDYVEHTQCLITDN